MSVTLPFLFAPTARLLGVKKLAALLAPMIVCFTVAGWAAYGVRVSGTRIVTSGHALQEDEARLEAFLIGRGIHHGIATYWEAYTLTFLSREQVLVVPREPWLDRMPSVRARVLASDKIAYIVDRSVLSDRTALTDFWLKPLGTPYERTDVG
ncbi:MAG: hypothetical protein ACRELY_24875, partial [Polyangiaceae bacterium]